MTNLESQTRLEVVLDLTKSPKELIAEIRAGILGMSKVLVLTARKGEIAIDSTDLKEVIAFVRNAIPNIRFLNVGNKITFSDSSDSAEPVNPPSAEAPVALPTRRFERNDDAADLYGHHGEWGAFGEKVAEARELASKANRISSPEYKIKVDQFGFSYRGQTLSILVDFEKPRTVEELRQWRNSVDSTF